MAIGSTRRRNAAADYAQAAALAGAVAALRCLSPKQASNLGGFVARLIGPRLRVSRVADANLRRALPLLSPLARADIIRGVWDNLGRTTAELPHLASFQRTPSGPGWEIEGEEHLARLSASNTQALFFSGHFGNWELILPIAASLGLPIAGAYRAASNAQVNTIIQAMRHQALGPGVSMFAKGAPGARAALRHLSAGGSLGLLVDQKMNDGIAVPFFGEIAMTAPALAQFALRTCAPILPVRVTRIGPARFRLICDAPLELPLTGDRTADIHAITMAMNDTLERWIRADPASWLWLHRRWPKVSLRQKEESSFSEEKEAKRLLSI
jgi:KDO2-lipid IV(A) lauroyltransferase